MKKTVSVITIILGLVVIIMGLSFSPDGSNVDYDSENYYAGYHSVKSASFGADFYTYTYDALDTIVDELSSVENGVSAMVSAQNTTNNALKANTEAIKDTNLAYKMIIISMGIGIFCFGLYGVANANPATTKASIRSDSQVNNESYRQSEFEDSETKAESVTEEENEAEKGVYYLEKRIKLHRICPICDQAIDGDADECPYCKTKFIFREDKM